MTISPPVSDSSGFTHDPGGINTDRLAFIKTLKTERRGSLSEYAKEFGVKFYQGERPWGVAADFAFPCATQNELGESDARSLVKNGCGKSWQTFTRVVLYMAGGKTTWTTLRLPILRVRHLADAIRAYGVM